MSLATHDLESYTQSGFMSLNNMSELPVISANIKQRQKYLAAPSAIKKGSFSFQGRIQIPGLPILPKQFFKASVHGNIVTIQNESIDRWPVFSFEFELEPETQSYRTKDFAIVFSDKSVDGWVLYTRLLLALSQAKAFSIQIQSSTEFSQADELQIEGYELLSESEEIIMTKLAALCRKLQFIQEVFREKLILPNKISSDAVRMVELLYRGITEGEFTSRDSNLTFKGITLSKDSLKKSPFTQPGLFSHKVGPYIELLGKKFQVGSIVTIIERAALGNPRVIKEVHTNPDKPVDVRFEVLDNLVRYRFEMYAQKPKKQRTQKLNLFKQKLAREEPQWIVDLIDESLQDDLSADEALQIAAGWQQYNDLPDRFCPQEPILDEANRCWRVPIYLVYANGEGGQVGTISIDLKTGKVIQQTPIDQMFQAAGNIESADDSDALSRAIAKMINRSPEEIAKAQARAIAKYKPEHSLQPGQTIFDAVGGKWPGDESDQQIKEALEKLS
jgi:hypothetical protein